MPCRSFTPSYVAAYREFAAVLETVRVKASFDRDRPLLSRTSAELHCGKHSDPKAPSRDDLLRSLFSGNVRVFAYHCTVGTFIRDSRYLETPFTSPSQKFGKSLS